ncbi:MAG: hypothetical protein ABI878_10620 [Acidobacteriota bacterium]
MESEKYMGLSGYVRSVREESYNCTSDPLEKPWRVSEVTYDKQGHETWRAFYNADGSPGHQASTVFDADGQTTSWSEFYGVSDFPPAGLHKHADFIYSGGHVVQVLVYREKVLEFKTVYSYDARGNKIREVTTEIAGGTSTERGNKYDRFNHVTERSYSSSSLSGKTILEYDLMGNITKEAYYDNDRLAFTNATTFDGKDPLTIISIGADGNVISKTINKYNSSGKLVLTTTENESVNSKTTIDYGDAGKISLRDTITIAQFNGKPMGSEDRLTPGRIVEKYNEQGQQVERYVYDVAGNLWLTQLSSYDELGRQTRLIETSHNSQYDRDLVYGYDSKGNRVKESCRQVTATGEVKLLLAAKKMITYF